MTFINTLDTGQYMVIDQDTGTVLNADTITLVPVPDDPELLDEITSNDNCAIAYAKRNAIRLLADIPGTTPDAKAVLAGLRIAERPGYAVAAFTPDELKEVDALAVEEAMIERGNDYIAMNSD